MLQGILHFTFNLGKYQDDLSKAIRYLVAVEKSAQQLLEIKPEKLLRKVKNDTRSFLEMNNIKIKGITKDFISKFKINIIGTTKRKEIIIRNTMFTKNKTYREDKRSRFTPEVQGSEIINLLNYGRKSYVIPGPENRKQANHILIWKYGSTKMSWNWKKKRRLIHVPKKEPMNFLENIKIIADDFAEEIRQKIKTREQNL